MIQSYYALDWENSSFGIALILLPERLHSSLADGKLSSIPHNKAPTLRNRISKQSKWSSYLSYLLCRAMKTKKSFIVQIIAVKEMKFVI